MKDEPSHAIKWKARPWMKIDGPKKKKNSQPLLLFIGSFYKFFIFTISLNWCQCRWTCLASTIIINKTCTRGIECCIHPSVLSPLPVLLSKKAFLHRYIIGMTLFSFVILIAGPPPLNTNDNTCLLLRLFNTSNWRWSRLNNLLDNYFSNHNFSVWDFNLWVTWLELE